MTPPHGIDLDQYRTQAKALAKRARAADPESLERIRTRHPEGENLLASGRIQLADAQLVIAREVGYSSWPKLKEDLLYLAAVRAIDSGDLVRLRELLAHNPRLIRARRRIGGYDEGYFRGATLLHHVAGNPIRCPLPSNILHVAQLLLESGANANATTDAGETTIGLLLTSKQASEAGVALPLIDLLSAAGARFELGDTRILDSALCNVAPATARALIGRGAPFELRHAAGLGMLDELSRLADEETNIARLEEPLAFAAIRGEEEAARILVQRGAKGDVLLTPGGQTPRTALHEAANRGHIGIVRLLLENGANARVVEPHFGGTPAGWAEHGGHADIAAMLS